MLENTTADEALEAIRLSLIQWKESGHPNPIIPVYQDLDGDGIADFYGLDDNDQVITISGATIDDSVSVSSGGGIETDRTEAADG